MLFDGTKGDIINQYVRFCRVFNEQVRINGRTRKAVEETIRICQSEDVLKEYLDRQREEVIDIMLTLFDEETTMKNHDAAVERKGLKDATDLMAFLASNGRTDDIIKASSDEGFLARLLSDFKCGKLNVTK